MTTLQRTLARPVRLAGRGLHSGAPSHIQCHPAPPYSGVIFVPAGSDIEIRARVGAVVGTRRGVALGHAGRVVRTVEHLLAAAYALGIANLRVEVDGEELPALDGSASPYFEALGNAGVSTQDAGWAPYMPTAPVWVVREEASLLVVPAPALRISYVVPTGVPSLGTQSVDVADPRAAFGEEIAPARTWGFAEEAEALRAEGLALGASEDNTLGIGPDGYLWPPRFADEPARHKVLDLLGDLALLGRPLAAHVLAVAAGHALHVELARVIEEREHGESFDGS